MEEKRLKNQCFWCDERFTLGHRCKNRQLYIITIQDGKEENERVLGEDDIDDIKAFMADEPQL